MGCGTIEQLVRMPHCGIPTEHPEPARAPLQSHARQYSQINLLDKPGSCSPSMLSSNGQCGSCAA